MTTTTSRVYVNHVGDERTFLGAKEVWNPPPSKQREAGLNNIKNRHEVDSGMSVVSSNKTGFSVRSRKGRGRGTTISKYTEARGIDFLALVASTHFNALEVAVMLEIFTCLAKRNSNPQKMTQYLETQVLRAFLSENFNITDQNALFYMVSTIANGNMRTSATNFVKSFSTLLRGTFREKAEFVFRTYDEDRNGRLTRNVEFARFLNHEMFDINIASVHPTADPDQPVRETVEYLWRKFDRKCRKEVTFEDFYEVIKKEPLLMECFFSVLPSASALNTFEAIFLFKSKKKPDRRLQRQSTKNTTHTTTPLSQTPTPLRFKDFV